MMEEDYFTMMVIRHRFGYVPSQVAQVLLNSSNQTIEEIVTATRLEIDAVVNALIAMLQHDVVCCQCPYDVSRQPRNVSVRGRFGKKG